MLPEIGLGARDSMPGRGIARIKLLDSALIDASADLDGWITPTSEQALILAMSSDVQVRVFASSKVGAPTFSFDGLNIDYGGAGADQVLNLAAPLVINNNGFFGPSIITTRLFDVRRIQIKKSAPTLNGGNSFILLAELIAIL